MMFKGKKRLLLALLALLPAGLLCLWLLATSSAAICWLWLPLASRMTGSEIKAGSVRLSILVPGVSTVESLSFRRRDSVSIEISEASARVDFYGLLRGVCRLDNVSVKGVSFKMKPSASAAPSATASAASQTEGQGGQPASAPPIAVKIGSVALSDSVCELELPAGAAAGRPSKYSFHIKELSCSSFEPFKESKIHLSANLSGEDGKGMALKSAPLELDATLLPGADLLPDALSARLRCEGVSGICGAVDLSALRLALAAELKRVGGRMDVSLRVEEICADSAKSGAQLSGTLTPSPLEADLSMAVAMRSSKMLEALAAALPGCDLGGAGLDYNGKLSLKGDALSCSGTAALSGAIVKTASQGKTVGPLDISFVHEESADLKAKSLRIEKAELSSSLAGRRTARIATGGPCRISWGGGPMWGEGEGPALELSIESLPVEMFNMFVPLRIEGGTAGMSALLKPDASGDSVSARLDFSVKDLAVSDGDSRLLSKTSFAGGADLKAGKDGEINLKSLNIVCASGAVETAQLSASGLCNLITGDLKAAMTLTPLDPRIVDVIPIETGLSSKLRATLKEAQPFDSKASVSVNGNFKKSQMTVDSAGFDFKSKKMGKLSFAAQPWSFAWGPSLNASEPLRANLKVEAFEPGALGVFALGKDSLGVGRMGADISVSCGLKGDCSVKGMLSGGALLSPKSGLEASELDVSAKFDAAMAGGERLELKELALSIVSKGRECLGAALSGGGDLKTQRFKADFECKEFNCGVLNVLTRVGLTPASLQELFLRHSGGAPFKGSVDCDLKESSIAVRSFDMGLKSGKEQVASLSLLEPFCGTWRAGAPCFQSKPTKARLVFSKFDLDSVNGFLPVSSGMRLSGGLTADLAISVDSLWKDIAATGSIGTEGLKFSSRDMALSGIDPSFKGSVRMGDYAQSLEMRALDFGVKAGDAPCLWGTVDGDFKFGSAASSKLDVQLKGLKEGLFRHLPFPWARNLNLTAFDANGRLLWSQRAAPGASALRCDMNILRLESGNVLSAGRPATLSGTLSVDCGMGQDYWDFKTCKLAASNSGRKMADLSVEGRVGRGSNSAPAALTISSSYIDALALKNLFSAPAGAPAADKPSVVAGEQRKPSQELAGGEPPAVDMKGLNVSLALRLAKIVYGKDFALGCDGPLRISQNVVSTEGMKLTLNGSPAFLRVNVDLGKSDGYPFSVSGEASNISLQPIQAAFSEGESKGVKGELCSLKFAASGKGVMPRSLARSLSGTLDSSFKNLSIPNDARELILFRMIFVVVDLLPQLSTILTDKGINWDPVESGFNEAMKTKSIDFSEGKACLAVSKGRLAIKDFDFKGPFIKRLVLEGGIGLDDNSLDLKSTVNVSQFVFPISISGTMEKPKPDYVMFPIEFTAKNALNVLNNKDAADDIGKAVEGVLRGIELFKNK